MIAPARSSSSFIPLPLLLPNFMTLPLASAGSGSRLPSSPRRATKAWFESQTAEGLAPRINP